MRTAKEERSYYNKLIDYEKLVRRDGFLCPALLAKYLKPYLKGGETILDVGCGPGLVGDELKKVGWHGTLIGVDIAEKRLSEAVAKKIYTYGVHASTYDLPFPEKNFDVVLSSAMVGLTGPKSVQEMQRVVKSNGYLACVAGQIKKYTWSVENFEKSCEYLSVLPNAKFLLFKEIGTGYSKSNYDGEDYVFYLFQCE